MTTDPLIRPAGHNNGDQEYIVMDAERHPIGFLYTFAGQPGIYATVSGSTDLSPMFQTTTDAATWLVRTRKATT